MAVGIAINTRVPPHHIVDRIYYDPGVQDSGDLEAATRTITATAKPATADYSTNLTIASPPDARLRIMLLGLRWQTTIDAFGAGTTTLNYSVHVNGTERATGSWTATGNNFGAVNLSEGQFNLGSANTIEIFLWVNGGDGATISVVQFWLAWGYTGSVWAWIAEIEHAGFLPVQGLLSRIGTGTPVFRVVGDPIAYVHFAFYGSQGVGAGISLPIALANKFRLACGGSVVTDLNYPCYLHIYLKEA